MHKHPVKQATEEEALFAIVRRKIKNKTYENTMKPCIENIPKRKRVVIKV